MRLLALECRWAIVNRWDRYYIPADIPTVAQESVASIEAPEVGQGAAPAEAADGYRERDVRRVRCVESPVTSPVL